MANLNKRLRFYSRQLLTQLGLKDTVADILDKVGLEETVQETAMQLASKFYQRSQANMPELPPIQPGKRVLFYSGRIYSVHMTMYEGMIGWALRLRGADPVYTICDAFLTACELSTINNFDSIDDFVAAEKPAVCANCFTPDNEVLENLGWQPNRMSKYVQPDDWKKAREIAANISLADAFNLEYNGIPVGEHIASTAYRTLFSTILEESDPYAVATVRRLTMNAVVIALLLPRMFADLQPDYMVAHHGIYLTAGIAGEYARQNNIPVINWTTVYRRNTVMFSHGDTYHRTMLTEPVEYWENYSLTSEDEALLEDYLLRHYKTSWDTKSYNQDTDENPERIVRELGLDFNRPLIGMYTNLAWDANVHYAGNIFASHTDWLLETIEAFLNRPDTQLVIRIHPAEVKTNLGPVRQRADDTIRARFGTLPDHIKVIAPENPLSSYGVMRLATLNVVYGTKLGMEMAAQGLKVITAGEASYRNKGFTYDPQTKQQYFEWLYNPNQLPSMSEAMIERSRKYAYHFYFRRQIAFPSLRYSPNVYVPNTISDLKAGCYANLDVVCDGILNGAPFVAVTPF